LIEVAVIAFGKITRRSRSASLLRGTGEKKDEVEDRPEGEGVEHLSHVII
jgi:hypothetical protein